MGRHNRIGKLQVLQSLSPDPDCDVAVVMLHGFGADASDLYPLYEVLDPENRMNWYFPEAPLEVPIGPGFMGRAWFPLTLRELEQGLDFALVRPPGMDNSYRLVEEMMKSLSEKNIIMGGFSQGGMVATEVALRNPDRVKGLLALSATLLDSELWRVLSEKARNMRVFTSHGQQDPVLPYSGGQKLYEMLKKAGLSCTHTAFHGGHEIPLQVIEKARGFLKQF